MQKPYCMGKSQAKGYCFRTASGSFATRITDNGGNISGSSRRKWKLRRNQLRNIWIRRALRIGREKEKRNGKSAGCTVRKHSGPHRVDRNRNRVQAVQPFCRFYSGRWRGWQDRPLHPSRTVTAQCLRFHQTGKRLTAGYRATALRRYSWVSRTRTTDL